MKKIYLAGPDVFLEDAFNVLRLKAQIVENAGMHPLTPFDTISYDPAEIVSNNEELIRQADFIIADLIPFRGTEPDSGTVFEIGFGKALKKIIFAYNVPKYEYKTQVILHQYLKIDTNICLQSWKLEDFGENLNIMLSKNITILSSFEKCVLKIKSLQHCE